MSAVQRWLSRLRLPLLVIFLAITFAFPQQYNPLQSATTAGKFADRLARWTVRDAKKWVTIDFAYAAVYAGAAAAFASGVKARRLQLVAWLGAAAVAAGAVFDERENWRLRQNIVHRGLLGDEAVRQISGVASIKWWLTLGGGAILVAALVVNWLTKGGTMTVQDRLFEFRQWTVAIKRGWRQVWLIVGAIAIGIAIFVIAKMRPALLVTVAIALAIQLALLWLHLLYSKEGRETDGLVHFINGNLAKYAKWAAFGWAVLVAGVLYVGRKDDHGLALYAAFVGGFVAINVVLSRWRKQADRSPRSGYVLLLIGAAIGLPSLVVATVNVDGGWLLGLGLAVVFLPTAVNFIAEDQTRAPNPVPDTRTAWGAAAIALGLALLSLADIGAAQALVGTIALFIVVIALASNTSHDVVLVVLAVTLLWSLNPKPGDWDYAHDPTPNHHVVVAIGDSYMSGEGSDTYFRGTNHDHGENDKNTCRRAPSAYPFKLLAKLREDQPDLDLLDVACSGARTKNLLSKAQHPSEPAFNWSDRTKKNTSSTGETQLKQVADAMRLRNLEPDLVLVSIGGNDAGFSTIGATCGLAGDCSVMGQEFLDNLDPADTTPEHPGDEPKGVRMKVRGAYEAIKDAFKSNDKWQEPPILVVPYPVPVNESGCRASVLRPNEHRFVTGFVRALDRVLEDEAVSAGLHYLATGPDVFTSKRARICDVSPSKAAANQLAASPIGGAFLQRALPTSWFHSTFHPTAKGHDLVAQAIADWRLTDPTAKVALPADPNAGKTGVPDVGDIMGKGFDFCGSKVRSPATCHLDRDAWRTGALTHLLWTILVPLVLIVWGSLAVAVPKMRRWRALIDRARRMSQPI